MKSSLLVCTVAGVLSFYSAGAQTVTIYTSAQADASHWKQGTASWSAMPQPLETEPTIFLDPSHRFQSFIGIGGAVTDASAETFYKLPKAAQDEFLRAYYDTVNGIGYRMARTNMNSCDFSSDTYTYVKDNDKSLGSFDIAHDLKYKLPLLKAAYAQSGRHLKLFISPWSPPAWMKDNHDMLHGGKLLPEFADTWANYYVKFIKAYEGRGVPVWGLTVQNEPMARQRWESCIFTAEEERDFVKNHLGPVLARNGMSSKKLMAWDHNRDLMYQRASVIFNDAAASKYIWGMGFHWYETWTGGPMQFQNVARVKEAFPSKHLVFTEGCKESFKMDSVYNWSLGERYATSMINDFNNGTEAWTDWNVLLDETGGPNHVGNFCFAPIHGDTRSGKLIYTNAYYYIGHFSKFIQPGAERISVACSRAQFQATGFRNPDGSLVIVAMNATDKDIPYHVWLKGKALELPGQAHSISTLIIR